MGTPHMHCALVALCLCSAASAASALTLHKAVVFSRHGIRVPFKINDVDGHFYSKDNRSWFEDPSQWGGGGVGYLTKHGGEVVQAMGDYWKQVWVDGTTGDRAERALGLPPDGSHVTVYADLEDTRRDIETAEHFMAGLFPGANLTVHANNYSQYIFNIGGMQPAPGCAMPDKGTVDGLIGDNPGWLSEASRAAVMRINDAVGCCQAKVCTHQGKAQHPVHRSALGVEGSGEFDTIRSSSIDSGKITTSVNGEATCTLMDIASDWVGTFWQYYNGPLSTAAQLGEYLQLMYMNGMDYSSVSTMTEAQLSNSLLLHQEQLDLTENFVATQAFGSDLVAHLIATMDNLLYGVAGPDSVVSRPTDKLVYYAGHDINIYFLRFFFRMNWLTKSYNRNQAMPGGMLTFQLYTADANEKLALSKSLKRGSEGDTFFVKVFFSSQTYSQQRNVAKLGPVDAPDHVFVSIPTCSSGPENSCPYEQFVSIAKAAIREECVVSTRLRSRQ